MKSAANVRLESELRAEWTDEGKQRLLSRCPFTLVVNVVSGAQYLPVPAIALERAFPPR